MPDLASRRSALLLLEAFLRAYRLTAATAIDNTPVHRAAGAYLRPMTLAVTAAFNLGRKALGKTPDAVKAAAAVEKALLTALPPVLLECLKAGGEAGVKTLRTAGDVEGHSFHGNQWKEGGGQTAHEHFKTSKGTDAAVNAAIVKQNGVIVKSSAAEKPVVEEALAHVITDSKVNAEILKGKTVEVKDLGNRYGNMSASLYIDSKVVKQEGAGFTAAIIYHELQHAIMTRDKVLSGQQESRVKYKTQVWAGIKAGSTAKTNPAASNGFAKASKQSRVLEDGLRTAADPFVMRFDVSNPAAAAWAREHAGKLAKDVSETTRQAIADAVAASYEDEGSAYDAILEAVGDEDRAAMIARTETMAAANEGNRQSWDQAVENGLLDEGSKKEWIAAGYACPECEELDGEQVGLDEEYSGDGGEGPPLHPNCRCTEGIVS